MQKQKTIFNQFSISKFIGDINFILARSMDIHKPILPNIKKFFVSFAAIENMSNFIKFPFFLKGELIIFQISFENKNRLFEQLIVMKIEYLNLIKTGIFNHILIYVCFLFSVLFI